MSLPGLARRQWRSPFERRQRLEPLTLRLQKFSQPCRVGGKALPRGAEQLHAVLAIPPGALRFKPAHRHHGVDSPPPERARAAAYAGYLSPKLELEVREVWLRYGSDDATLADEILQRATAEENRWAGARAISRSQGVTYRCEPQ